MKLISNNINKILKSLLLLVGGTVLTGCYDDLKINNEEYRGESGFSGLLLHVPNAEGAALFGATRADEFNNPNALAEAEEGKITTLWLCAFPQNNNGEKLIKKLDENSVVKVWNSTSDRTVEDYTDYQVKELKSGTYNFYVLANLDEYLPSGFFTDDLTETQVRNLQLDFNGTTSLQPGHLPMACISSEIKKNYAGSAVGNTAFEFIPGVTEIWADLSFLCTKVRYTIFFDNTESGFSREGAGVYPISFKLTNEEGEPSLFQVRRYTDLIFSESKESSFNASTGFVTSSESWKAPLNRVVYPTGDNGFSSVDEYPKYTGNNGTYSTNTSDNATTTGTYHPSYITTEVEKNLTLLDPSDKWENVDRRAWQGVLYIPENRQVHKRNIDYAGQSTDLYDYRSKIVLKAQVPVGTMTYNIFLLPDYGNYTANTRAQEVEPHDEVRGVGIWRSTLYDVVGKVTNLTIPIDISYKVTDWNLHSLTASLAGPTELTVDKTEVSISAGKTTEIVCTSNQSIGFVSPKFKDTNIEFYTIVPKSGVANTYEISINKDITFDDLASLKEDPNWTHTDDPEYVTYYKYFHVVSGNLNKKIKVDPLDLSAFLIVNPEVVNITVREYYVSGEYDGIKSIDFITNVDDGVVIEEVPGFDSEDGITYSSGLLSGITGNENRTTQMLWLTDFTPNDMEGRVHVNFQGFNSGDTYWQQNHDYKLKFSVDNNDAGIQSQAPPVIVKIHVRPFVQNYVIHFKDNTKSWSYPHIYVYQCLELPKDLSGTNARYAGRTVGYNNSYNGGSDYLSALEYGFTNQLSFLGWSGYGGSVNPNQTSKEAGGFIILGNNDGLEFSPRNQNSTGVYDHSIDFNHDHFSSVNQSSAKFLCKACEEGYISQTFPSAADNSYSFRSWPGVVMEKEDDGWWKYTLTSVATPGKALIMFSDGHDNAMEIYHNPSNGISGYRFPDNAQVGVPLFDFPDNEGWFLYDGNIENKNQQFTPTKPESNNITETKKVYRILWPSGWGNGMFMNVGNSIKIGGWESGRGMRYDENWYMYEFTLPSSINQRIQFKMWQDGNGNGNTANNPWNSDSYQNDPWGDWNNNSVTAETLSTGFTRESDGIYYAYLNSHGGNSVHLIGGDPQRKTQYKQYDKIEFQWAYNMDYYGNYTYIYIWNDNTNWSTGLVSRTGYNNANSYHYYDFDYNSSATDKLWFIVTGANWSNQSGNCTVKFQRNWDKNTGRLIIYINDSGIQPGKGKDL